jgi:hypothetical protein
MMATEAAQLFRPQFELQSEPDRAAVLWNGILPVRIGSGVEILPAKNIPDTGKEFPRVSKRLDQAYVADGVRGYVRSGKRSSFADVLSFE